MEPRLPRPKVRGIGRILYRCAKCGATMEPEDALVVANKAYHPEHLPERDSNGS